MEIRVRAFSASEAETATGRSQVNQRNDRRLGYSDKIEGHARHGIVDLSRKTVIQQNANIGLGPKRMLEWLEPVARCVAEHAKTLEAFYSPAVLAAAQEPAPVDVQTGRLWPRFDLAGFRCVDRWISDQIEIAPSGLPSNFAAGLVVWADGRVEVAPDLREVIGGAAVSDLYGAVSMIQFSGLARLLAQRLPRPLFYLAGEGGVK